MNDSKRHKPRRAALLCLTLALGLAACCPTPQLATGSRPTAFVAEVVGTSESPPGLRLSISGQEVVTAAVTEETLISGAKGERLELRDLSGGLRVYLVGRLRGAQVSAEKIQVLGG